MSMLDYKAFPRSEYESRWKKAREIMDDEQLDALLITEPLNYHYFSGAAPSFSYARCTIIVFPRKEHPVVIVHEFVEESTRREAWIEDVRLYKNLAETPLTLIKDVFEELKLTNGRIGTELGYEQRLGLTYNDFTKLKQELTKTNFVDASNLFWKLRMIKSKAEVNLQRKTCKITSEAYEECFEKMETDMTEKEVGKIFLNAMTEKGGSRPWCFINSGPYNYSVISGNPTNQKLKKGNTIWIDGGCNYGGYWSDFCRIASIGSASEKQREMHETTVKLTEMCVDMVKPGVKASDIAKACDSELKKRGLKLTFKAGRIGHGVGLMLTEPPHIASYDKTDLEPGMIITLEPGFVTDYGVFQTEQNILVTEDSHEILSTISTKLREI